MWVVAKGGWGGTVTLVISDDLSLMVFWKLDPTESMIDQVQIG